MAREATVVELYGQNNSGDVRRFTVGATATITKGDILKLVDPRTASRALTTGDIFAGIASADKDATDSSTSIGCWENGIFEMTASGAIAAGTKLITAAPGNYVMVSTAAQAGSSFALIVGTALEAADNGEVINVRVNN